MSIFDVRIWGVALMLALAGMVACAENVDEKNRQLSVILKRLVGLRTVEIYQTNPGFEQCKKVLIERLVESDAAMKFLPDDKLIDDLQDQAFLRFMTATKEPVRVMVGALEQSVTDILIPLEGRWGEGSTVFYRNVEYGGWQARSTSHVQKASLLPCTAEAVLKGQR